MFQIQTRLSILDAEIGPGLGSYLLQHPMGITPVLCKSWEELFDSDADLALVGADYWGEEQAAKAKTSGIAVLEMDEANLTPYQPAALLIKAVYRMALEKQIPLPGALTAMHEKEVIAVCSPHGYDLQTGFAVIYSLLRADTVRTLYLDFTYYNGFFDTVSEDVGDLFYEMHKHRGTMQEILHAMVQKFGPLDYLPPVRYPEDLEEAGPDSLAGLLHAIAGESSYETVVVDVGSCKRTALEVLKLCEAIYLPVKEDSVSLAKLEEFDRYLELSGNGALRERIHRLKLPYHSCFGRKENYLEQLVWGELGDYTRKLLRGG